MDEVWGAKFAQRHEGFGTGINRFVECLFRNPVIVSVQVVTRLINGRNVLWHGRCDHGDSYPLGTVGRSDDYWWRLSSFVQCRAVAAVGPVVCINNDYSNRSVARVGFSEAVSAVLDERWRAQESTQLWRRCSVPQAAARSFTTSHTWRHCSCLAQHLSTGSCARRNAT